MIGDLNYEVRKQYYKNIVKKVVDRKLTKIDITSKLLDIKVDPEQILLSNYFLVGKSYDA